MDFVGGQAVVEGVMMKSKDKYAIAVRDPEGKIKVKVGKEKSWTHRWRLLGLPFIRGPVILLETLILGIKSLNYSADVAAQEDGEEETKISPWSLAITLVLSIALALVIFKLIPLGIAQWSTSWGNIFENRFVFNLVEGLSKIIILIGYIYLISFMPDVKRVFQYHGAEHKVVNAYEKNDLANAEKYSTINVRCGTSFVMFVMALSIIVYLVIPVDINFVLKYGLRLLMLPLIASFGYELIKISPSQESKAWFKAIMSPGLMLQKLTTKEPNEKQIEVAMLALRKVV
tara:strand:- start:147 stop:1007 length:861 start_codon:yes stop_codon:yes gene_type:complete